MNSPNPLRDVSRRAAPPRLTRAEWTGFGVSLLVTAILALVLPWEPDRVSVTIHNPTDHQLQIDARSPTDPARTFVVIIDPHTTRIVAAVIDRGPDWILEIHRSGQPVDSIPVARDVLVGGTFSVPDDPSSLSAPATADRAPRGPPASHP